MRTITLINGDGIGPEISKSVVEIIKASGLEIDWDIQTAGEDVIATEGVPLPDRVLESIKKNKIALKAPVTTPIGKGFRSVNVQLRKDLDLYANLRPCKNLPGVATRFDNVDLVVVRENTEDLYAGVEEQIDENTAHSIKIITRKASERICKFAFDYAVKNMNGSSGRQRVTAETIGKYILPRLTDDELAEFRDVVPALFSAMRLNSLENISLAELRDALLPKLMSGEIDVSDIQI